MVEKERNDSKESENKGKPGHGKRILLRTFGCQMNIRDSEFIAGLFLDKGYKLLDSPTDADVILFNTCSVRAHAEERAIQNMASLMYKYKNKKYGVIGCAAQALKDNLFKRLPRLNIVCGTGEIAKLPELTEEALHNKVIALGDVDKPLPELKPSYRQSKNHAYVSIMRGCNNFCSYCIVPYVRGKERSRKIENIICEIKELIQRDINEIMLLGQNVNSYSDGNFNFVKLLKEVNNIENLRKISFMTSHPKDVTLELFTAMRDLPKVAKHLHLPLQSGSDRILKLMNRGYTQEKYLDLVTKAREVIPGLKLTTDIIVGFPTEGERDFNDTLNLLKEIKFDSAYIFKYSPRTGTQAAKLKDDVPQDVKKKRHKVLLDLMKNEKNNCLCHK